jgi:hypothetical protein
VTKRHTGSNGRRCDGGCSLAGTTLGRWVLTCALICGFANAARADSLVFSGTISQSTQDGTGPAVNNPSLNAIQDGDLYRVVLAFAGSINGLGTYNFTGGSLGFFDPAASAAETSFGFISLTVSPDASFDDLSLLSCLSTGSGCFRGNQLAVDFRIFSASLNSVNVTADAIPGLTPSLDLLEDDGVTDIQGSVTNYSYVPEPPVGFMLCPLLALLAWKRLRPQSF